MEGLSLEGTSVQWAPSQEAQLLTGAREMVGCSEGFLSRAHLHPGQQPFPCASY